MKRLRGCMRRTWSEACAALLVATLCGCAALGSLGGARERIYDVRGARTIDRATLVARLAHARYRLLGELHDNPEDHRVRADLLSALAASGQRPAVVFEQFDLPHDDALARAQAAGANAEALADAGQLDRRGWKWPMHEPIVAAALAAKMPIHAGNVPRSALQPIMEGEATYPADAGVRQRLDVASWTPLQERTLEADIADSHCGALPEALVPRLARAQRVRDASMAEALVRDATQDGAILIAGNGHARKDVGVPNYLPRDATVSVGFLEMEDTPAASDLPPDARAFDYVWVTKPVERPDPCAEMERVKGIEPSS